MTPRLEWTWDNFFASGSIRFYCWRRCFCVNENSANLHNETLWRFLAEHELTETSDGSIVLREPSSQSVQLQLLPAQNTGTHISGTCGKSGDEFCAMSWPANILGPLKPIAPPDLTQVARIPGSPDLTICGNKCSRQQDCIPTDPKTERCICAEPSPVDAQRLGLDPVFPPAVCLALGLPLSGWHIGRRESNEELENDDSNFLDTSRLRDERGRPYQCLCNATYIANICCGVEDGLVWIH